MMCPKCGSEDLAEYQPGVDPLMDDGVDVLPEDTFVVLKDELHHTTRKI